ncbi:MAG: DeoR/GlpR transcriptional regulator [Lachnospiraceae bacterium]|nr:DeoR/GlpR transcriptional regulator [Lachnospiraceae bacterium]
MLSEQRQQAILQLLQERKAVTVQELSQELKISDSTIRRDLHTLDKLGKINKVHGGATAILDKRQTVEEDMESKKLKKVEEKKSIAQCAVDLLREDDFIFIDAGSTTGYMIDYLPDNSKVVVVTNGVEHARRLVQKGIRAYLLGGEMKVTTDAMVGEITISQLKNYNFTKSFLGTNGVHEEYGYTTPDVTEAEVKREVMNRSLMRYVLADSSKFNQISSVSFGILSQACIITEQITQKKYCKYTSIREVEL